MFVFNSRFRGKWSGERERKKKKKWGVRHDAISEGSITIRKRKEEKGGSHFLHQLECLKGRGCGTVFFFVGEFVVLSAKWKRHAP